MKISLNNIQQRFISIMLFLFILSIPTALIYKINFLGVEFGISYLILLILYMLVGYYYFLKLHIVNYFWKIDIFLFFILIIILSFMTFLKGFDTDFWKFFLSFFLSFLLGAKYINYFCSNKFVSKFLVLALLLSSFGILLYYLKIPIFDFETAGSELYFMNSDGYYRAMSIFLNPNSFGYFIVFSFALLIGSKQNISFMKLILYSSIFLVALYLTYSRSAQLSLALIFLYIFIGKFFNKRYTLFLLYSIFFIVILTMIIILLNLESFYFYDVRFEKWSVGLSYLNSIEYFILGVPTNFLIGEGNITFSDNMFIYLFLKNGFLFFLFFIFLYLRLTFKAIKLIKYDQNYVKSYSLFIVSIIFPMYLSNYLLFFPSVILVGISLGVISNIKSKGVYCENRKK